ncbi:MAG TPA: hypothetical protein VFM10_04835, partial [Terriglobales bacterium]|nr:hypothetical protein [Terriglobales bacterium]
MIVDDREPGREIERRDDFQPLVDKKQAFPVGFHVVEAFAPERLLRRLDPIDQVGKPIEGFDYSRQMLDAARPGFACPLVLKGFLLI